MLLNSKGTILILLVCLIAMFTACDESNISNETVDHKSDLNADFIEGQNAKGTNTGADEVEKQATGEALKDVTLFDLMGAFRKVLADIKRQHTYHKVEKVSVTVEEQSEYILRTLQEKGRRSFLDICLELKNISVVVVTFLAVLEMLKEQQINLFVEEDDPTQFYIDLKPVDEIIGVSHNVKESS